MRQTEQDDLFPQLVEALAQAVTMLHDVYNKDTPSIKKLRALAHKARDGSGEVVHS